MNNKWDAALNLIKDFSSVFAGEGERVNIDSARRPNGVPKRR